MRDSNPADATLKTPTADAAATGPRPVTIKVQRPRDGVLPVVISVMPTANLNVAVGVFVDVRLEPEAELLTAIAVTPATAIEVGLVAKAGNDARSPARATLAPAPHAGNGSARKASIKTHRVAPARLLSLGVQETFETEIALPAPDASGRPWLVRGRFSTGDGNDLRSTWTRVR